MLNTLDYIDIGTTMKKEYIPQVNKGEEIIYIDGEAKTINSNQKWFWEDSWFSGEKEVDRYIQQGNVEEFETMEDFISSLKE